MDKPSLKQRLIELINEMNEDQQRNILNYLESEKLGYRKYQRNNCDIPADYTIKNKTYMDFIRNISAGGVYITAQHSQSIGQEVSMNFTLPGHQKSIRVYGRIVRASSKGFAVKFYNEVEELLNKDAPDL